MTKNRSMKIAVLVLALALLTSCFVGSTFAKYTSSATGSHEAVVVAKWAFTVNDTTDIATTNTFTFNPFTTITDDETFTSDDANVYAGIAPGTGGTAVIALENTSDVRAKYTVTYSVETTLPLEYSKTGEADSWTDDISEVTDSAELGEDGTADVKFFWRWAFVDADDTNATDTALGKAGTATAKVTATVKAEQVD